MDVKATVARNLAALIEYHGLKRREPLGQRELARKAKVTHKTVARVLKGENGAAIDTLDQIASVFDLQAWHLLIPDLDPANPPVVSLTKTERELYERLTTVAKQVSEHHDQRITEERNSPDRSTSGHR